MKHLLVRILTVSMNTNSLSILVTFYDIQESPSPVGGGWGAGQYKQARNIGALF